MKSIRSVYFYDSPPGRIAIVGNSEAITHLYFSEEPGFPGAVARETALLEEAAHQLKQYFAGRRKIFELPLAPEGTTFQLKVWRALRTIPYGQTRSYGQIARVTGNEKAARAVGAANNKNPISIIIPCHRVIGADGKLVGYGGGLERKAYLLELEKRARGQSQLIL
ncbi:MAG: methylated-DNA--[protein]-cysteine S-methyltransferase [Bacteroidales bacterium]|jgi:methylated-DNA-[protein]-cysteine S-methyltransferase|nr:methylated-DNA--[protein]-cysteine S-methyltransferase [Bacteroidales bacterium]